jgi:large subunit ribosomal protein L23
MEARHIVKRVLTTEKSTVMREAESKYAFMVDLRAGKHQIKNAIEKIFKVHVTSIRTVVVPGKVKRLGRYEGKTAKWKKAVVKLAAGEQIAELENL